MYFFPEINIERTPIENKIIIIKKNLKSFSGRTHLRRVAPEYNAQHKTPRLERKESSVTTEHCSGTVHLRSEGHIGKIVCVKQQFYS